jgi:predicted membrane protein
MTQSVLNNQAQAETSYQQQAKYSIIGILTFTAILVLLDLIEPNYDAITQAGSDHLNGPYRWVMAVGLFALGIGCWYLAAAVNTAFKAPVHSRTSVFMFRFSAVGFLLAGLFPAYKEAFFADEATQFEIISTFTHFGASLLAFVTFLIAGNTLTNRLRKAGRLKGKYIILQLLAILAIIGYFLMAGAPPSNAGVMQRVFLFVFLFPWAILFALGIRSGQLTNN